MINTIVLEKELPKTVNPGNISCEVIPVTKTYLPPLEEYMSLLQEVWASGWITNRGTVVRRLEERIKDKYNINNILIVNNGTIALQIALKALNLSGEIITTPFSYVATTSSIVWENCIPVFADIDPESLTIDPEEIVKKITPETKGILATHVYGNACDIEALEAICKSYNLKLIFDAAHCFGVEYNNQSIFNYGDISTTSFHATKLFHTIEGGAIFCKDPELFHKIFYMHNFGHNGCEDFYGLGINGKISEVNAGMGMVLLNHLNKIIEKRKAISSLYDNELNGLSKLTTLNYRKGVERNYAYYPVILDCEATVHSLIKELNAKQIFPRRYFYPSLNLLPYISSQSMPVSEDISKRVLCLPLYPDLAEEQVLKVIRLIKGAI